MSPALMLDNLTAARTIERHEQACAYRRRRLAGRVRSRSGWRERIGWRLVEVGLGLTTSAESTPVRDSCH
ncbi:MAG: hypothetical protein QOF82_3002 [Frankiales bacterium]|jgi:hypothetical protein|nr:hypothetical protein [Frankiales bacterium]MDX6208215.1 hypothetical protein [Frankiales bacterium]MDX6213915.1 hypothetical protein [Frankiales bacterium]